MKHVATSIVLGKTASAELAAEAVRNAMQKADLHVASSVLLFLTSEFANTPQTAIKAAAKAASCTQVMGCTASGIFTEQDWVLDAPAAAAMVFGGDICLASVNNHVTQQALLTLTAPNAMNSTWLNNGKQRYGGVSGDAIGQGAFSVWQNAKGELSGYVDAFFNGANVAIATSHGLQLLNQPQLIERAHQFDILQLGQQSAFASLQKTWKFHSKTESAAPLHLMMAVYADSAEAIAAGQFNQTTIITSDEDTGSLTLAQPLKAGQFMCWGLRDSVVAVSDMTLMSNRLASALGTAPSFGLMFSCLGRGPYFYDGIDRDLEIVKHTYPNMPLLGFYGNGEIAYINGHNQLLPYSAVLSLFSESAKQ
jgi:small ligand-binding sensory domain FIST